MLKDMQNVREKAFMGFRKGEISLEDLELVLEFVEKVGFVENLNLSTDQYFSGYRRLFRDTVDYGISIRDIEKGLELVDNMYANSLCSSWPVFNRNFNYESFLKCGDNIQPQSIKQKGLYIFTTEMGHKVPIYYSNEDEFEFIIPTNEVYGALCSLPEDGKPFCSFVNRNKDKLISMELIKTPEEITKELAPIHSIHDIFRLANGGKDLSIYDKNVCYYERRSPAFIKVNFASQREYPFRRK